MRLRMFNATAVFCRGDDDHPSIFGDVELSCVERRCSSSKLAGIVAFFNSNGWSARATGGEGRLAFRVARMYCLRLRQRRSKGGAALALNSRKFRESAKGG